MIKKCKHYLKLMASEWNQFWFGPQNLFNVSLFRCLLGFTLLGLYLLRYSEFSFFMTEKGILSIAESQRILPEGYRSLLPFFLKTDKGIEFQGILHLVLLFLFGIGAFGRSLTWLLFIVNLGLNQRNMSIVYGADLFSNFWLFYLSFVDHNRYFSIWNFLNKSRRKNLNLQSDWLSSAGIRLCQAQLCLCYMYTGFEKLKGAQWWEGTAVWYVISMDDLIPHDFAFMKRFPLIVAMLTMSTVAFEVYFIFAVWTKRLRYPWLIVGFLFHMGTAFFMDLWFFGLVMTTPYLLFLPPLEKRFNKILNRGVTV